MRQSITPNLIKQNSRSLIYHYIYKNQKVSQQDISYDLRLSRPVATTNLRNLAAAINMLHLVYDTDFILGGYLASYLCQEDLAYIHEKIRQMTPFAEPSYFLLISKMPKHNISIGAALPYIQAFLHHFADS